MRRYEHGGNIYTNDVELDFSVNTNPLGMPNSILKALSEHADEFMLYPDPYCGALREKIAKHHNIPKENILCGNGAADLIFRICACLKPKCALTLAPSFSEYERPARLFGARIKEHILSSENDFSLTDKLLYDITDDVDMVFLCNPNNPTGRAADSELILAAAQKCVAKNAYLVIDECFIEFTQFKSMMRYLNAFPNIILLRAFTKLYSMAGLRLGYIVASEEMQKIASYGAEWSVSVPAQIAGIAALSTEPCWAQKTKEYVALERERVTRELTGLGLYVTSSDANFLLIKSQKPLYEPLLNKRILVRDCSNFTGLDEHYIRIGLKTPEKNDVLLEAIRTV